MDVRFGSKADILSCPSDVRFTPESDIRQCKRNVRKGPQADITTFLVALLLLANAAFL